jgi:hypothetical protein
MERVAGLPCVICWKKLGQRTFGVHVHHVGDASDRNDYAVAPLCPEHHQGSTGVHGLHRRGFERMWKVNDIDLLAWTNEALAKF